MHPPDDDAAVAEDAVEFGGDDDVDEVDLGMKRRMKVSSSGQPTTCS